MAGFYQDAKSNVKENLRDAFEDRTGILGETIRKRREAQERQQEIQSEVAQINQATAVVKKTGGTLSSLELSFTQISENFQNIAKALQAQVTTFDETLSVQDYKKEQVTQQKAPSRLVEKIDKEKDNDESMFSKLDGLLDLLKRGPKGKGRGGRGRGRAGRLSKAKRLAKLAKFAKLGGRILGPVGLLIGANEAREYLKEANYGDRMAKGQGQLAEQAFKNKNTNFSHVELTQQQAMDILSQPDSPGRTRDIASYGGIERLQQIAGIKTRSMGTQGKQMGATPAQPGEGRATVKDERWLKQQEETEAEKIKAKLTPSQLEWLGEADPTDPAIMKRMPAPLPSEVAVQVAAPPPAAKPPAPPPVTAPVDETEAEAKRLARMGKAPTAVSKPAPAAAAGAGGLVGTIISSLQSAGITSMKAISNILATIKAETNFKIRSEDLTYRSAESIQKVFGKKRIPSVEFAGQFVNNPEALANEVYKSTDGNSAPGDGWKYRGRGWIQHTGKNQYQKIKEFTGIDVVSNPDLLNDPVVATKALAWFFLKYKNKKPEQLENMSEVNKAVGFADTTGEKAALRAASAEQITASMTSGKDMNYLSENVASAKKSQATGTTVVVVNNTTNQTKGAASPPPRTTEVTSRVGA
jgi:putative chitinase